MPYSDHYIQLSKQVLLDPNISLYAKGLYAHLRAMEKTEPLNLDELPGETGQLLDALIELVDVGYISCEQVEGDDF